MSRAPRAWIWLWAVLACPSATLAAPTLWNGIEAGTTADALYGRFFQDARQTFHPLSRQFGLSDFYVGPDDPVQVRLDFDRATKRVCGVDIQGEHAGSERRALLAAFGPPDSGAIEAMAAPAGGAAAPPDSGTPFRIWTWERRGIVVTSRERAVPGYFVTLYRIADARGRPQPC